MRLILSGILSYCFTYNFNILLAILDWRFVWCGIKKVIDLLMLRSIHLSNHVVGEAEFVLFVCITSIYLINKWFELNRLRNIFTFLNDEILYKTTLSFNWSTSLEIGLLLLFNMQDLVLGWIILLSFLIL